MDRVSGVATGVPLLGVLIAAAPRARRRHRARALIGLVSGAIALLCRSVAARKIRPLRAHRHLARLNRPNGHSPLGG